jgi:hypothetical protein
MVIGMAGLGASIGKGIVDENSMKIGDGSSEDLGSSLLAGKSIATLGTRKRLFASSFLKGICLATLVGVLNGSFLIPLKYAHKVGWNL